MLKIQQQLLLADSEGKCEASGRPSHAEKMQNSRASGELGARHTWNWMRFRCYNPACHGFSNYGGRGIKICDRWKDSFSNFLSDIGPRPVGHVIDRIDVNGDYTPENCRWVPSVLSMRNQRRTTIPYEDGETGIEHDRKVHREWIKRNRSRRREYLRRYNAETKDHRRAIHRRWAQANRERRNEYQRQRLKSKPGLREQRLRKNKEYYWRNLESLKLKAKEYASKNKDLIKQKQRAYYLKNRETLKSYARSKYWKEKSKLSN